MINLFHNTWIGQPMDTPADRKSPSEILPYPSQPLLKGLFKSPITLYRLGLGPVVGKLFMVMTTTGRKSGLPRRTAIEYHAYHGRKYVMNGYGMKSDWYRNILADPRVTIQTADGVEAMLARRVTSDAELAQAYEFAEHNPIIQGWIKSSGQALSKEQFVAEKERWCMVTFDATDQPAPPALEVDLEWVWPLAGICFWLGWMAGRKSRN